MNEADTCRKFVVPKLQSAGWDSEPHSNAERRTITDGRIVPPVSDHGQIGDIIKIFGGADKLRGTVNELQTLLYAA